MKRLFIALVCCLPFLWAGDTHRDIFGEPLERCQDGAVGGGQDPDTGLYDWTCANYDRSGEGAVVNCTAAETPHAGCHYNGQCLQTAGFLHNLMLAVEETKQGGTVYLPNLPGCDHGTYLYEGCDTAECPTIFQSETQIEKRPANRIRYPGIFGNRKLKGAGTDPNLLQDGKFTGTVILDNQGCDRDDGSCAETNDPFDDEPMGIRFFYVGGGPHANRCYRDDTDADCNFDNATATGQPNMPITLWGRGPVIVANNAKTISGVNTTTEQIDHTGTSAPQVGDPIEFVQCTGDGAPIAECGASTNAPPAGVVAGRVYWVHTRVDSNTITVCDTPPVFADDGTATSSCSSAVDLTDTTTGALYLVIPNIRTNLAATATTLCVQDEVGLGVCSDDNRIACTSNGARSGESSGGCSFTQDPDAGTCMGGGEALADMLSDGERVFIAIHTNLMPLTDAQSAASANGTNTYYAEVTAVGASGTCNNVSATFDNDLLTARTMTLGANITNGTQKTHDWPFDDRYIRITEILSANVINKDVYDLGEGYNLESVTIAPNDYLGRSTCTDGTQTACDSAPTMGLVGGYRGGINDVVLGWPSHGGQKATMDFVAWGVYHKIHNVSFNDCRRGLLSDVGPSSWRDVTLRDCQSEGTGLQIFGNSVDMDRLTVINSVMDEAVRFGPVTKNSVITNSKFINSKFVNGAFRVGDGSNVLVDGFSMNGVTGGLLMISPGLTPRNITFRNGVCSGGRCASAGSSTGGFGVRADAFIRLTDLNGSNSGTLKGLVIDNVHGYAASNTCFIWVEDPSDATFPLNEITITNSTWDSTVASGLAPGVPFFCTGVDSTEDAGQASDASSGFAGSEVPRLRGNVLNGAPLQDTLARSMTAAQAGDCQNLVYGTTVLIHDDTAAGACTDAGADGILDGGGSAISACACDPTGDSADGQWLAFPQ